jgi:uncharacterized membrane protein YkoI
MISRQAFTIAVATMLGIVSSAFATEPAVSRADAERIALTKVGSGTVQSAELEQERGALAWVIDISSPDATGIQEIVVDAKTGRIVRVGTATPTAQKKETPTE